MHNSTGRQSFTLLLVFGAVAFGMFLAGGTTLTPAINAEAAPPIETGRAVSVSPSTVTLPSFADLADAVSPAVVSIQATRIEEASSRRGGDPFEFFFGPRRRPQPDEPRERRSDSAGSGFVISPDGLIITNHHVIEDASELQVALNGRTYPAEVKGDDPATDLALLKIEPVGELEYLRLADSESVRVGDWVMVIGSPLRLTNSVSVGVVSAKGRNINITPDSSLENFIQTDAAINFGNSGGPMVDLSGAVVGIATAINFGAENIGFAVPSNTLKSILPQLRERGSVSRGYLGVNIQDLDYEEAEAFGLESTDGALVHDVLEDSPAQSAGIKHGDVILKVDDHQVKSNRDLIDYVSSRPPGEKVNLKIFRNGKKVSKTVTLGEREVTGAVVERPVEEEKSEIEWLGLQYQTLTPQLRSSHSIPDEIGGVWITGVAPSSPLYNENVRANDFISEVNGTSVSSGEEFEQAVEAVASGSFLRFYVTRLDPRSGSSNSFFAIVRVP